MILMIPYPQGSCPFVQISQENTMAGKWRILRQAPVNKIPICMTDLPLDMVFFPYYLVSVDYPCLGAYFMGRIEDNWLQDTDLAITKRSHLRFLSNFTQYSAFCISVQTAICFIIVLFVCMCFFFFFSLSLSLFFSLLFSFSSPRPLPFFPGNRTLNMIEYDYTSPHAIESYTESFYRSGSLHHVKRLGDLNYHNSSIGSLCDDNITSRNNECGHLFRKVRASFNMVPNGSNGCRPRGKEDHSRNLKGQSKRERKGPHGREAERSSSLSAQP